MKPSDDSGKDSLMPIRALVLLRLFGTTAGVAALRRGLLLYLTIIIVAVILFAGQGLDASTVVRLAEHSRSIRAGLLGVWLMATMPVARSILATPQTFFVRSLPVSRLAVVAAILPFLACAELPWFVLFARGGGWISGGAALLVALALHAILVARLTDSAMLAAFAGVFGAWLLAPPMVRMGVAVPSLAIGLIAAWRRAPEWASAGGSAWMPHAQSLALATAYGTTLRRRHGAALIRSMFLTSTAAVFASLLIRNSGVGSGASDQIALAIWILAAVTGAATLAGPVLSAERGADWVLEAHAVRARVRRAASMGLLATAGAIQGVVYAAIVSILVPIDLVTRVCWLGETSCFGAALSVIIEPCMRWALREHGTDSGRMILALLAEVVLAEMVVWFGGQWAVAWIGAGALAFASTAVLRHGGGRLRRTAPTPGARRRPSSGGSRSC
jgi:hypothetical protein